jgi:hypothetical protein
MRDVAGNASASKKASFAGSATVRAQSLDLNILRVGGKSGGFRLLDKETADRGIIKLDDLIAGAADKKLARMHRIRHFAGDERIERIDTMNQPGGEQEFQRAIHGWRSLSAFSLLQRA